MRALVLAVILIGIAVLGYFGYRSYSGKQELVTDEVTADTMPTQASEDSSLPDANPQEPSPVPPQTEETPEFGALANLDDSDNYIRASIAEEQDKELLWFLQKKHLIRNGITSLQLIHENKNPSRVWPFPAVRGRLEVEDRNGRMYLSEKNFERYDSAIRIIENLDGDKVARLIDHMHPLLDQAFRELGLPQTDWRQAMDEVIDAHQNLEFPDYDLELLGSKGVYIFANPTIEALAPMHKAMIRMGPDNAKRLRKALSRIRAAMQNP